MVFLDAIRNGMKQDAEVRSSGLSQRRSPGFTDSSITSLEPTVFSEAPWGLESQTDSQSTNDQSTLESLSPEHRRMADQKHISNTLAQKLVNGSGVKTLKKRIKQGLVPTVLDTIDITQGVGLFSGSAEHVSGRSPVLSERMHGRSPGLSEHMATRSPPMTGSSSASGTAARKRTDSTVFAETPLWCGENPFTNDLMMRLGMPA
jgi:hypothetical protein